MDATCLNVSCLCSVTVSHDMDFHTSFFMQHFHPMPPPKGHSTAEYHCFFKVE